MYVCTKLKLITITYKMIDGAAIQIRIRSTSLKCCAKFQTIKMLNNTRIQNAALYSTPLLFLRDRCVFVATPFRAATGIWYDKRLLCPMQSSHQ